MPVLRKVLAAALVSGTLISGGAASASAESTTNTQTASAYSNYLMNRGTVATRVSQYASGSSGWILGARKNTRDHLGWSYGTTVFSNGGYCFTFWTIGDRPNSPWVFNRKYYASGPVNVYLGTATNWGFEAKRGRC